MRVLLVSTYELGHQPLHVAAPAAALRSHGHDVRCEDLSVSRWSAASVDWAEAIGFSVPMHTAMRMGLQAARAARRRRPATPICFYGLYAPLSENGALAGLADHILGGEYEPGLVEWVDGLAPHPARAPAAAATQAVAPPPARGLLPPLDAYAHLAMAGEHVPVGYVETSRGCVHKCRHCPVPVEYDGRIRIVEQDRVLSDVAQQAAMGARHITFGDPDFLNGVRHSVRVVRAMHQQFPDLTFDCTAKVEHILEHADIWPEMASCGCLFVVSAFESVNDAILARLDKGHRARDASLAVDLLRGHGIETRPSWLPFTPWTEIGDVAEILRFVVRHDLVGNVDPVQYTIRLLLPPGSLLLDHPDLQPYLGPFDDESLSYTWRSADPRVDELQTALAAAVEQAAERAAPIAETLPEIAAIVAEAEGQHDGVWDVLRAIEREAPGGRPRITEPWFC